MKTGNYDSVMNLYLVETNNVNYDFYVMANSFGEAIDELQKILKERYKTNWMLEIKTIKLLAIKEKKNIFSKY